MLKCHLFQGPEGSLWSFPRKYLSPCGAAQEAGGTKWSVANAWKIHVISCLFPSCTQEKAYNNALEIG